VRSAGSDSHFLRSDRLADELVVHAAIGPWDHVVDIGAGDGRLTAPLARRAGKVTAVELDPGLADGLRRRFSSQPDVVVVEGDILRTPLPRTSFRAFGNIPFSVTTPLLRRLLDEPAIVLERADLVVQFEAARKRASVWPTTLLSLTWLPWWELALVRRVPRRAFEPPPDVDAGLLRATRRPRPLLAAAERPAYVALLRRAFDRGAWPVRRSLRPDMPPTAWKRLARQRGFTPDALPSHLDVFDWVEVLGVVSRHEVRSP
jgi:23S rRNA (adenine-N6)-dimethyltransferase